MSENPIEWVEQQGFEYTIDGTQLILKKCPVCHADDSKFYMNAKTGLWDCKHLNKHGVVGAKTHGNLFTLKRILGLTKDTAAAAANDSALEPLSFEYEEIATTSHARLMEENPSMLRVICDEWGITEDSLKRFTIGIRQDATGKWWITIPHYVNTGTERRLYNLKYRSWFGEPKDFRRIKGAASVLHGQSILYTNPPPKSIVLTEGEKDRMLAMQAGVENVIGMTGGAGTLKAEWYDLMEGAEDIVIAYDGDVAGTDGVQKLISRFGIHRCRVAALPAGKDIADVYREEGPERVCTLIAQAARPAVPTIAAVSDLLLNDVIVEEDERIPTFSPSVDKIFNGGVGKAQLIVLTAPPKVGKTTFSMRLAIHWSLQGMPGLLYCIEMLPTLLARIAAGVYWGTGRDIGALEKVMFKQQADLPLYLGYDSNLTVEVLLQTLRDAHARYGLEYIIFDNIHYLVRSLGGESSKVELMEAAFKGFKVLANELNIPIICIAQPRKIDVRKGGGKDMNYYDVAWTSSAASDADTICILHRDRSDEQERSFAKEMLCKVDAGRYTQGGRTYLTYREYYADFTEMTPAEITLQES